MAWVILGWVQELTTNQASEEEGVDGESDDLRGQRCQSLCGKLGAVS